MSPIIAKPLDFFKACSSWSSPCSSSAEAAGAGDPAVRWLGAHPRGRRRPGDPGRDQPVRRVFGLSNVIHATAPVGRPVLAAAPGLVPVRHALAGLVAVSPAQPGHRAASGPSSPTSIAPGARRSRRWAGPTSRWTTPRCSWCWAGRRFGGRLLPRRGDQGPGPPGAGRPRRHRCTSRPTATASG